MTTEIVSLILAFVTRLNSDTRKNLEYHYIIVRTLLSYNQFQSTLLTINISRNTFLTSLFSPHLGA